MEMICKFKVTNFMAFKDEINVDFNADGRIKKFLCNCFEVKGKYYIKSLGIYGPNNTGKSCLFLAFHAFISLLNPHYLRNTNFYNMFGSNTVTDFDVQYIVNDRKYRYKVSYDSKKNIFIKENLFYIYENPANPSDKKETSLLEKTKDGSILVRGTKLDEKASPISIKDNGSISILNLFAFNDEFLARAKVDFDKFVNSFIFIDMNMPVPINMTIDLMKKDKVGAEFVKTFVKDCDVNIEDLLYSEQILVDKVASDSVANYINKHPNNAHYLQLNTKHHGVVLPSSIIDSAGTRQLIALSSYIYHTLKDGKILVIDEIDRSLHHIITRAIVSLFNSVDNTKAQLIFTTHDLMLLNIKTLLRKEQIILTDIDKETKFSTITQFSKFTADEYGIRGNEDITDYYLKGRFGAIPNPDLFECLRKLK